MMLHINIALLGISALTAIVNPSYIQKMAQYENQEVLIKDWGIYACTLVLIMTGGGIDNALLFCYTASIIWNFQMYHQKRINVNPDTLFFKFAIYGNLLGISEILYYKIVNRNIKKEYVKNTILPNGLTSMSQGT